jgi:hypothetical protein
MEIHVFGKLAHLTQLHRRPLGSAPAGQ